jgi:hypothetical protein
MNYRKILLFIFLLSINSNKLISQIWYQAAPKLVGKRPSGTIPQAEQGSALSLSPDGNQLAIGGPQSNSGVGATWIFNQAVDKWDQQDVLIGGDNLAKKLQGSSVSLLPDGTIAVGAPADENNNGAVWVFTKSGSTYQKMKLVITGPGTKGAQFGTSVAFSQDGTTLAIGAPQFVSGDIKTGATFIFEKSVADWIQQAAIVGRSNTTQGQGTSVDLSEDGNTLAVGAPLAGHTNGATYIFTRSGTKWSQQAKLVATGPASKQGTSVSLSGNGNVLAIGGPENLNGTGSTWIFTRTGSTWSEVTRLIGKDSDQSIPHSKQGTSVDLSADGNIVAIGGPADNKNAGATWIFTKSGSRWEQEAKIVGVNVDATIPKAAQGTSVSLSADGDTLAVGGPKDDSNINGSVGATWIFKRAVPGPNNGTVTNQSQAGYFAQVESGFSAFGVGSTFIIPGLSKSDGPDSKCIIGCAVNILGSNIPGSQVFGALIYSTKIGESIPKLFFAYGVYPSGNIHSINQNDFPANVDDFITISVKIITEGKASIIFTNRTTKKTIIKEVTTPISTSIVSVQAGLQTIVQNNQELPIPFFKPIRFTEFWADVAMTGTTPIILKEFARTRLNLAKNMGPINQIKSVGVQALENSVKGNSFIITNLAA